SYTVHRASSSISVSECAGSVGIGASSQAAVCTLVVDEPATCSSTAHGRAALHQRTRSQTRGHGSASSAGAGYRGRPWPGVRLTARWAPRYHNRMRTDSQNRHRARSRSITGLVLCLPLLASLFGSSGFAQTASDGRLSVIVTIQPWASLSRDVGGEHVDVVTLLPAGASPHAFDPAPSQAVALARADIVIMNGGLDDWLLRLLDATAADVPRFTALDVLDPDALSDSHEAVVGGSGEHDHHDDDADHGHDHDHGGINSHVWLDPVLASHVVTAIADEFAAIDPANAESYLENGARVVARLHELDVELREILD